MAIRDDQAQIGFEQLGLGAVLKRYRLLVPPNQRDYAWTAREVSTLLEDLSLAISEDEQQHFLGTIVTIPRAHGILEVVDGQQRLATTALLLAAMRHVASEASGNLSRALDNYLVDVDTHTLELTPKMRLNSADTTVFHELLLQGQSSAAKGTRESHKLLVDAYKLVRSHLGHVSRPVREAERIKVFIRWMNYIEHSARVILLIVPNTVNAFKMFETLNDRGLRVSQSDLVKNYIFGQSADRLDEAQQIWSYTKGALETLDEDDITINFLRQALISINGYLRESEVYEKVQHSAKGAQSSIAFLTELEYLANDYVSIANPDSEKWNAYPLKIRRLLRVLQLFDIKPFRPVLLSIARRFTPKEATIACERLVAYGVRLIIAASTRSGSVEQPLARAAKEIYDGRIVTADSLSKELHPIVPNDEQFREAFENATVSQAKFARYYLRSLEMAARKEDDPWLIPNDDPEAINLEHVLPLKPMDNWPEYTDDMVKATSMISTVKDWTPEEISKRQKYLAGVAVDAWPIR